MFWSRTQLAAENLFLRKQLACYVEREVRPRHTDNASRIALVLLSQFVEWGELGVVKLFAQFGATAPSRPRTRVWPTRYPATANAVVSETKSHSSQRPRMTVR